MKKWGEHNKALLQAVSEGKCRNIRYICQDSEFSMWEVIKHLEREKIPYEKDYGKFLIKVKGVNIWFGMPINEEGIVMFDVSGECLI